VLLFFTKPLQYLPRCVLGAIVFIVAIRLLKLKELRDIRRESPGEFWLAATTAVVVVAAGVEQGIVLAIVMSLLRIVQHSYHPHTAVLVEEQGGFFQLTAPIPGAISEPGLVIYRFGAPLFYANAGRFADEIRGLAGPSGVRWVLVDAGPITKVDYSAARTIRELLTELADRHVELALAHVEPELQADLDRHQLTPLIGPAHLFDKLHDAIAHYRELTRAPTDPFSGP
jgi:MFS superfamily sulfate permease-like transporter